MPASSAKAILNARRTEGFVLPFSMLMMVCLLTPTRTASSSCVMRFSNRRTRMRFFIDISAMVRGGEGGMKGKSHQFSINESRAFYAWIFYAQVYYGSFY